MCQTSSVVERGVHWSDRPRGSAEEGFGEEFEVLSEEEVEVGTSAYSVRIR